MGSKDPFAAFLACRPASDTGGKGKPSQEAAFANFSRPTASAAPVAGTPAAPPSASAARPASLQGHPPDVLSAFIAERKPRTVEEQLQEEIVRKKRQLLEVALQEELESLGVDPQLGSPTSMQRLRQAQKAAAVLGRTGAGQTLLRPLKDSTSTPNLKDGTAAMEGTQLPKLPQLPKTQAPAAPSQEPLLGRWYSKTKSWNIALDKKLLVARRVDRATSGGAVILGDGRMPFHHGPHMQVEGYYFSVQIEDVDNENFPLEGCRDLTMAIGVSRLPAGDPKCHALYAYEIPGTVVAGHNDHFLEERQWWTTPWSSRSLKVGDVVGCLISPQGDFVIYVNNEQVLRLACSLNQDEVEGRRALFPVVDLHGRISSVKLLPYGSPPNAPLASRSRRQPKQLLSNTKASKQAVADRGWTSPKSRAPLLQLDEA